MTAPGATWLDRQLVAREPVATGNGFGANIREAMKDRADFLVEQGLARKVGDEISFKRQMIDTLKGRDLDEVAKEISKRTGLEYKPSDPGNYVSGRYTERVNLSSGRFAMIEDGLSFQLVPWRPKLEHHIGERVIGTMTHGGVEWTLGRGRGLER